ncbi:hypothetical protein Lalb_Chr09g0322411 [Lupinus albus]|uniref:Uncharacterized protein n=1 Tax=Lupinus albus TaxID=3870 RepID=A0A6A4PZ24_LUPAL|nr:hypothetical protein Lalb_Chr09g0322411 [Lupinus albus]
MYYIFNTFFCAQFRSGVKTSYPGGFEPPTSQSIGVCSERSTILSLQTFICK